MHDSTERLLQTEEDLRKCRQSEGDFTELRRISWAGTFENVVVRKHMTHPFYLAQN